MTISEEIQSIINDSRKPLLRELAKAAVQIVELEERIKNRETMILRQAMQLHRLKGVIACQGEMLQQSKMEDAAVLN